MSFAVVIWMVNPSQELLTKPFLHLDFVQRRTEKWGSLVKNWLYRTSIEKSWLLLLLQKMLKSKSFQELYYKQRLSLRLKSPVLHTRWCVFHTPVVFKCYHYQYDYVGQHYGSNWSSYTDVEWIRIHHTSKENTYSIDKKVQQDSK